jgi:hypothetical protein
MHPKCWSPGRRLRPFSQLVPIILGQLKVTDSQYYWASKSRLIFINFQ